MTICVTFPTCWNSSMQILLRKLSCKLVSTILTRQILHARILASRKCVLQTCFNQFDKTYPKTKGILFHTSKRTYTFQMRNNFFKPISFQFFQALLLKTYQLIKKYMKCSRNYKNLKLIHFFNRLFKSFLKDSLENITT